MSQPSDVSGAERFFHAAASGATAQLAELLQQHPELVNERDERGHTALHLVALGGWSADANSDYVEAAKTLLDAGADVGAPASHESLGDSSPLILAAYGGGQDAGLARLLLERGADPNATSSEGVTALQAAAERGARAICDLLLTKGAELDIHSAAALGMRQQVREMLRNDDALAREKDRYRRATPLYYAALHNQKEIAQLLLNFEADINATTNMGNTAVHVASAAPARRTLELLLDNGGDVNARNYKLQTPLHYAVEEWWAEGSETVRLLIERGANVSAKDETRQTPLAKALARNKLHIAEILRASGARD